MSVTNDICNIINLKSFKTLRTFLGCIMHASIFSFRFPIPHDSDPTQVTWPRFTEQEEKYLVLDLKPRVERQFRAEKVAFWNEIVPKVLKFTRKKPEAVNEKTPKDEL